MKKDEFLEKYHSRKTYIIVKFLVNFLFIVWFVWLLNLYYKDWELEIWGIRLILIALLITIWFFFDKLLKNHLNEKCYSKNKGYMVNFIINTLFVIWLILLLKWFSKNLFHEVGEWRETWDLWPFFIALFIVIWISFDKIVDSLFLASFKIDENMDSLPKSIEWEKTLVQYDLSKLIAPSEVWFLLYAKADISNLLCIIYKRVNEKIIEIYSIDWKKYMKIIGELWDNVPYYEKYLFQYLISWKWDSIELNKSRLRRCKIDINDLIFEKCRLKWYCNIKANEFGKIIKYIAISLLCIVIFVYLIKDFIIFVLLFWWVGFLFIIPYAFTHYFYKKYSFVVTDKWKKALSEICWYKYYLENCEEDEIIANLWEKEIYSRHLPYAIALKLNRKIIDELF